MERVTAGNPQWSSYCLIILEQCSAPTNPSLLKPTTCCAMSEIPTMNEDNEFHSSVRFEKPSVDQNASPAFDLVGLPIVPKHLIFRYLDMESLNKIRQTGHSMNNFVVSHRNRLLSYGRVLFVDIVCLDETTVSDKQRNTHEVVLYNRKTDSSEIIHPSEHLIPDVKWKVETERGRASFFRGFADRFCKTHIAVMVIINFSFGEEDMDHLKELWKKRQLRMDELVLAETDFFRTPAATVIRFIKIVRPSVLCIKGINKNVKDLLTAQFYDLLPSLRFLYVEPKYGDSGLQSQIPISPAVNTLPATVHLPGERRFPIGVLKNALHSWWRNETPKIEIWNLNLDGEYFDPEVFAEAIDLPCDFIEYKTWLTISHGRRTVGVELGFLNRVTTCKIHSLPNRQIINN